MATVAAATEKKKEMSDIDNQIIRCPYCKTPITVDEVGEYVNANPETKKRAIEEQFQLWGGTYDKNYLIQNLVFCPNCHKVSYFKDWDSNNNNNKE